MADISDRETDRPDAKGRAVTHQTLLAELKRMDLTEPEALTLLSDAAVISDHCLRLWDIAQPDLDRAILWFRNQR